jgi:hypothetical protein
MNPTSNSAGPIGINPNWITRHLLISTSKNPFLPTIAAVLEIAINSPVVPHFARFPSSIPVKNPTHRLTPSPTGYIPKTGG